MRLCIAEGAERIELCDCAEFGVGHFDSDTLAWQHRVDLHEPWQADAFVQRHLRGAGQLYELRKALASQALQVHRLSDEQVLHQVIHELRFGGLRADVYSRKTQPAARLDAALATPVVARPERPTPAAITPTSPPQPAPVSPPTAPPQVAETQSPEQAAAQDKLAEMLEQAAQTAAPLCEICELAKSSKAPAVDNAGQQQREAVQDEQAQVLEQAAVTGTAFCEVCERNA